MNFLVIWDPRAFGQAVALGQNHPALAAAFAAMATALEGDPLAAGESRGGDNRIAFFRPLAVTYRVDPPRRRVYIYSVYPIAPLP
ncbi:MAG: hypothetical protein K2X82_09560 [Gemmataceae bacterium]|nr:hypothetical protein [Gemmataceae bacterium]